MQANLDQNSKFTKKFKFFLEDLPLSKKFTQLTDCFKTFLRRAPKSCENLACILFLAL
jgi:hypothetical protein